MNSALTRIQTQDYSIESVFIRINADSYKY